MGIKMKYRELEILGQEWKGEVCLWGAGLIGKTWGYELIKAAGFSITYFCDSKSGCINYEHIRSTFGVEVISPKKLFSRKPEDVLVFITVAEQYQTEIEDGLTKRGFTKVISVGYSFLQEIAESILENGDEACRQKYACIIDDQRYLYDKYYVKVGKQLDLSNPQSFNEKLQWLKLYDRNPLYTGYVDKVLFKEIISKRIGKDAVIPLLGIWKHYDEIDFNKMPAQFVLKCAHDSGSTVFIRDKSLLKYDAMRNCFEKHLALNYYWTGREWPYRDAQRVILAEPLFTDESGIELKDYKVFVFNGKAKMIQVDFDRFGRHRRNLYTTEWDYIQGEILYPCDDQVQIKKPMVLSDMVSIAEELGREMPHVRVDMYVIGQRIIIGEMTFYHGSGYEEFRPASLGMEFGSWLHLPEKREMI